MRPRAWALAGVLALSGLLAAGAGEAKAQGFGFYPPARGFNLSIGVGNYGFPGYGYGFGAPGFGRPGFGVGFPGYGPRPLPIWDPYCPPGYGYSYYRSYYGYGRGRGFPYY